MQIWRNLVMVKNIKEIDLEIESKEKNLREWKKTTFSNSIPLTYNTSAVEYYEENDQDYELLRRQVFNWYSLWNSRWSPLAKNFTNFSYENGSNYFSTRCCSRWSCRRGSPRCRRCRAPRC